MNAVKVVDNLPSFQRSLYNVLNDALNSGARDIHVAAKTKAPYQKGSLRSNSDFRQQQFLKWRVSFWVEYARFQEFGGDGKRIVKRYTTPGTGAHYLQSSGDFIANKLSSTLKIHANRARV